MIPDGHKTFFNRMGKRLSGNVFLAGTDDDWNGDKESWTQLFQERGSTVYCNYQTFKAETHDGVFVLPPTPGRATVRRANSFRDLLCQHYDFFHLGFDHSGTFIYSKLFPRGSTILITFNSYKNHTEETIAIVNHLQEQTRRTGELDSITWKLAGPPNLLERLSCLHGKVVYDRLISSVANLDPRVFVELDTDTDASNDDMVESLAVWAYEYDDGAMRNRYSVVVYDDTSEAESVGRWSAVFQNLFFRRPHDYLYKSGPASLSAARLPISSPTSSVPESQSPAKPSPPAILGVAKGDTVGSDAVTFLSDADCVTALPAANPQPEQYQEILALDSSGESSLLPETSSSPSEHRPDIATTLDSQPCSKKRPFTALNRCPQPKRARRTRQKAVNPTLGVHGSPVRNLEDVHLLDNGSAEAVVSWEESVVAEADIDNDALRRRFKEMFRKKYGEETWKQWVRTDTARNRRYGRD